MPTTSVIPVSRGDYSALERSLSLKLLYSLPVNGTHRPCILYRPLSALETVPRAQHAPPTEPSMNATARVNLLLTTP